MNLLLDTHIFIWSIVALKKLSAKAQIALRDKNNLLFLSVASVWEMQLKVQTRKLALPVTLPKAIEEQERINGLQILPITLRHVYELENLPFHHKDPFDRILISQAIVENFTLVTTDAKFTAYSIKIL
jgi:PIN domain nuclease of toxin-antitoxin system